MLKMVRRTRLPSPQQTNGATVVYEEYIGEGEDHMMAFDVQDTADLAVMNVVAGSSQAAPNGQSMLIMG